MGFWLALRDELAVGRTAWLTGLVAITVVLVRAFAARQVRLRGLIFFYGIHLLCLLTAAGLATTGSNIAADFRAPGLVFGGVTAVGSVAALLFGVGLSRTGFALPRVVQDVLVAIASLITGVTILSRIGFNLSGLIATSAVATATIGFALQDFMGNLAGGLALQLDNSIEVGDWVKVGDVNGRVVQVRWRHTEIETRNWETVVVPNSILMKNQVLVLGKRTGQPLQARRWVWFNVDYRFPPSQVIDCVTEAIRNTSLERVATTPQPNCVLMELGDSFGKYAVRYWLTDIANDDPTDSSVRVLIYFALKRAGMHLSIPAQQVFNTERSTEHLVRKQEESEAARRLALTHVELFAALSDGERAVLAQGMVDAPFCRGETLTRQGAEGHWLYLVDQGEVSVRVKDQGLEKEVSRIAGPGFFGEMSLMTGSPRVATVVALTDVRCYRLGKSTFQKVIAARPELAESLAKVLADRKRHLDQVRSGLEIETASAKHTEQDLLMKIRQFFGLNPGS